MPQTLEERLAETASRKERFRKYFRAFNPAASPVQALESGFVNQSLRTDEIYKKIANRADIDPSSVQAVVGGIGSGKTTELLLAAKTLEELGIRAHYVEAANFADLTNLKADLGLWILGNFLIEVPPVPPSLPQRQVVVDYLNRTYDVYEWESRELTETSQGVMLPHSPPIPEYGIRLKSAFSELVAIHRENRPFAVLIDGLDRVTDLAQFERMMVAAIPIYTSFEIPLICVAPIGVLFGPSELLRSRFDRIHEIYAINPRRSEGSLQSVLQARDADALLLPEARSRVVSRSGGVIRDLITLARDAGEFAYQNGSELVRAEDVDRASSELGGAYLRGLSTPLVARLKEIYETGNFDVQQPQMLNFLISRRVIEFSATEFSVHPAIIHRLGWEKW